MIMNKKYIGIVAGLLLLAGCANEDAILEPSATDGGVKTFTSFTATLGDVADTRAYLGTGPAEGSRRVYWDDNDGISVFSDLETDFQNYSIGSHEENRAVFGGNEISGNQFYALYPPSGYRGWEKSDENPNILYYNFYNNEWAPYDNNNYSFNHVPMIAKSSDNTLNFKQVTGMIHVQLGGISAINYVSIRGNNDEILGDRGYIDLSEDEPVYRLDNNAYSRSIGISNYTEDMHGNKDIYFILPPMTFEQGFTLYIQACDENGQYVELEKTTTERLEVDRATVKHFALVDVNAELEALASTYREKVVAQLNAMEDQQTANALLAFYDALNGGRWDVYEGWGRTDVPVEEWQGLQFSYDDDTKKLIGIYLDDRNLSGDVPAEIANLPELENLSLQGNHITSLPEELWSLTNLYYLDVARNKLSGPLPAAAKNLSELNQLLLFDNNFEGSIPDEWFTGFGNLTYLYLNGNRLIDTITEEEQATDMWQNLYDYGEITEQQEGYGIYLAGQIASIQFNATKITLKEGESFQLVTTILPESVTNMDLVWNYDPDMISLDEETGTITVIDGSYYSTSITLHDNVSGREANCMVYIEDDDE